MKTSILSIKKILVLFGLGIVMTTYAQEEVLLAQYSFDDGSKDPAYVADNITFEEIDYFTGNQETFTVKYETQDSRDCLILWNQTNTLNAKRGFVVPVTPMAGKEFVFTRMEIIHKTRAGANNAICWIVDAFSVSDAATTSNIYFFGSDASAAKSMREITSWKTESFEVNDIVNYQNTYTFNSKKYILFNMSCTKATNTGDGDGTGGYWDIDDIQFYGYESGSSNIIFLESLDELKIKVLDNGIEINAMQNAQLEIYTPAGASVLKQEINSGTKNIDLSTGMYIARLSDGKNCIVKKIVIK